MADIRTTQVHTQGTNNHSNCNQAAGQDTLQDQPLVEAKALVEAVKVGPNIARDTQTGVEDLNKEASVANEVDLVGPQDSRLQLPDLVISSTGRRRQANMMMGTTRKLSKYNSNKVGMHSIIAESFALKTNTVSCCYSWETPSLMV